MAVTMTHSGSRRDRVRWLAICLSACALGFATTGEAQEMRFDDAVALLETDDPDSIQLALETLGARSEARAVAPIAARIRGGLPAELADMAVMTLGAIGRAEAGPVLFELLSHRRADLRRITVEAIAAIEPRGAGEALVRTLSDPDPSVRAAAALAIGQIGYRAGIDSLFASLDHDNLEAAQGIGQLATPAHVDRLFGYVGRLPLDALIPALNELFARDDFPAPAKIELIGRLAELATPEVKTYLTDLADSLPSGRVKEAAIAAAERITG
ncbi:MAG: hypothetical protein CMN30_21590 [Sandaracinus sp.]|nr:hypothetical protein [Sandaracinus sp.]